MPGFAAMQKWRGVTCVWLLGVLAVGSATAETLKSAAEQQVRAATFEVVLPKPQVDPLSYDRPLPLELLPFAIRTDKYQPIGTAFALQRDQFVTAAHVLIAAIVSPNGVPLMRESDGTVHELRDILQFSLAEDYAVFTTKDGPSAIPVRTSAKPEIGGTVYAVGNALGEGIVIRDGLLTSQTPEDRDGQWNWLRFSAAASPGNSGGPLLDRAGRVIGVVLGKSPSENLNYALPIERVLHPVGGQMARIQLRQSFGVPISPHAIVSSMERTLPLPMPYGPFAAAYVDSINAFYDDSLAKFVSQRRDQLFPEGEASQHQLTRGDWAYTLELVGEAKNGEWEAMEASGVSRVALPPDGQLRTGTSANVAVMRLIKPSAVSLKSLFTDSKTFMDLVLTAFPLTRPIADQAVRITSLGRATTDEWHVDHYGRRWQLRVWPLDFSGAVLITLALPKPDGADMMFRLVPTGLQYVSVRELEFLADFAQAGYFGSLTDWQAFLLLPELHPHLFQDTVIDIDVGKKIRIATKRFEFDFDNWIEDIGPQSRLDLQPDFFTDDDGTVVWQLAKVLVAEDRNEDTCVTIVRYVRPAPSSTPSEITRWQDRIAGKGNYSGRPVYDPPGLHIGRTIRPGSPKGDPNGNNPEVLYVATFELGQPSSPETMVENLDHLVKALKVLE